MASAAFPLAGKTAFITGASRGIGLSIGKMLAAQGANVAVAAKTAEPHAKLPGTIHTAAEEIEQTAAEHNQSSKALALQVDIRDAEKVQEAIEKTMERFGNLDIVINNASAISMGPTVETTPKQFDLMNNINSRGTWLVSRYALPHLLQAHELGRNPHILSLAPDLYNGMFNRRSLAVLTEEPYHYPDMWTQTGAAYAMAKVGMSLCTFALAAELNGRVGVNGLWPYTLIGTSAMKLVSPNADTEERRWRSPDFVAEAAVRILQENGAQRTSQFFSDELYLRTRHAWNDEKIKTYSLGGPEVPLEDLAEDLFITANIRDKIMAVRKDMLGKPDGYVPDLNEILRNQRDSARAQSIRTRPGWGGQQRAGGDEQRPTRSWSNRPPRRNNDGGRQRSDDFDPRADRTIDRRGAFEQRQPRSDRGNFEAQQAKNSDVE